MENYISEQLVLFIGAALLGMLFGLAYDLLRAVRRRFQKLLILCDVLFCLCVAAGLIGYTMKAVEGELRIYLVLSTVLGAVFYFCALSTLLRPLWDFWMDVAVSFGEVSILPIRFLQKKLKIIMERTKKLFLFWFKWVRILNYKWEFILIRHQRERGRNHETHKGKKTHSGIRPNRDSRQVGCLIALVIYAAVTLYHLHGQIQVATAQQVDLAAQVQVLQDRNQALRPTLPHPTSRKSWKKWQEMNSAW